LASGLLQRPVSSFQLIFPDGSKPHVTPLASRQYIFDEFRSQLVTVEHSAVHLFSLSVAALHVRHKTAL